ncbi:MAG: hypothetical protein ACT4P6_23820 [Gemmatimonadaceae bacterium]
MKEPLSGAGDDVSPNEPTEYALDDGGPPEDKMTFVGSYLSIREWLYRIKHPNPEALTSVRIFVGLHRAYFHDLLAGRLPPKQTLPSRDDVDTGFRSEQAPKNRNGFIVNRDAPGEARGVFSLLSNGSLLTVELAS